MQKCFSISFSACKYKFMSFSQTIDTSDSKADISRKYPILILSKCRHSVAENLLATKRIEDYGC